MMRSTFSSSGEEDSMDLFSPGFARNQSLHANFEDTDEDDTPQTPQTVDSDALPRLADNSWIGARVSPIPSVDEEDAEDAVDLDALQAPYRKAMSDFGNHERSALLGRRIHPLWNRGSNDAGSGAGKASSDPWSGTWEGHDRDNGPSRRPSLLFLWGRMLVALSAIHFFCILLHDAYFTYLQLRRGTVSSFSTSVLGGSWFWPWGAPSAKVLLRFGAYSPAKVYWFKQWYRVATSWVVVGSFMEWGVTAWAWWQLERLAARTPNFIDAEMATTSQLLASNEFGIRWVVLFVLTVGTGQLWMAAFGSTYAISGCLGWGTAGVLCAMGVSLPEHRLRFFATTIAIVILNALQPTSSVFGAIGGSFFGWSLNGVRVGLAQSTMTIKDHEIGRRKKWGYLHWLAIITLMKLWILPIAYIIFWKERVNVAAVQ